MVRIMPPPGARLVVGVVQAPERADVITRQGSRVGLAHGRRQRGRLVAAVADLVDVVGSGVDVCLGQKPPLSSPRAHKRHRKPIYCEKC
jgi:hypothetical protein